MSRKLDIAFVWHMHQPMYRDPLTGEYAMPWVMLHGTKDYYDMAAILEEFPDIHQTFNLVPSLMEQINDYASGNIKDTYRTLGMKAPSALTSDEKAFILQYFFQANWEFMIKPVNKYQELLRKRGLSSSREDIIHALRYFGEQDYLDLQVLFNLVWIDPSIRDRDKFLSELYQKGARGGYTEQEKKRLLDKQTEIMGSILPKYKSMQEAGLIEVSTTPYFHPIMPLLCDSFSAREAMPNVTLPKERFVHPEDAAMQLKKGIALYEKTFGRRPNGIWPSEGSVSMDILPLLKNEGIKWFATDEEILSNTVKRPIRRDGMGHSSDPFLYRPYALDVDGVRLSVIFRDHVISDLIGFDYSKMDPEAASVDLVSRLVHIYNTLEDPEDHLVSIILDGENAWECFRDDGRDFLASLYTKLSNHPRLRCTTVTEHLASNKKREPLSWIFPGSWISHNFKVWIGHHEDNTAWDYIAEARDALVKFEESVKADPALKGREKDVKEAWDVLYAAEGSDWFWWYGEEHSTMLDEYFDSLFRKHIKRIYQLIGAEPPDYLEIPISTEEKGHRPAEEPQAYLRPKIDGSITNYFEWLSAGRVNRQFFGSAMHRDVQIGGLIEGISYGFSEDSVFLRFDYLKELAPYEKEWNFTINFLYPRSVRVNGFVKGASSKAKVFERKSEKEGWIEAGYAEMASDSVVELGVPLKTLGAKTGTEIRLYISIDAGEKGTERWPNKGFLIFQTPTEDFEQQNWIV